MTDGKAMDPEVVQEASDIMKEYALVFAVGIGADVNKSDLISLATDPTTLTPDTDGSYPETVFTANYDSLAKLTSLIGNAACSTSLNGGR